MIESVYLGVSQTTVTSRTGTHSRCSSSESSSESSSVAEQLSSLLEIKAMTLQPATSRHQSGSKLQKNSEADRLNKLSTSVRDHADGVKLAANHGGRPRNKCPYMKTPRLVKRLSQATILDQFQGLTSGRPAPLSFPPTTNSSPQYSKSAPPPEYVHRCLPVSYCLKRCPISTAQSNVMKNFEDLRFALSSRPLLQDPLLQAPCYESKRGSDADYCVKGRQRRRLSSFTHYPTARITTKRPRKLISIGRLSLKEIPKELNGEFTDGQLPIVYNNQYNLKYSKAMKKHKFEEIMLPDKPACVYSILEAKLYKVMVNECVDWEAVDITSVFDITKFIPDAIRKFDIVNVARIMKVEFYETIPNWDDFDSAMLLPLRIQMMGSVVTCKVAMDLGWAVNIGGGFGHSTTQFGKGLAAYDDVLVCLTIASKFPRMNHILVVDCDAYQSSKYKYVEEISCPVTILDFYFKPYHQSAINRPSRSPNNYVEYYGYKFDDNKASHHLYKLWKLLLSYIKDLSKPQPSLCIYIAGTNVLDLNNLVFFTPKDIITRDQIVLQTLYIFHDIPTAILLGGGYQQRHVDVAAASIHQLCKTVGSKKHQNRYTMALAASAAT